MEVPSAAVRVELDGPSGERWAWGPEGAENFISGEAEAFCLVVAQRRHYADTELLVEGSVAREWMSIAQVFAGPPAEGPGPGRFPRQVK